MERTKYYAAMYLRLSNDDGDKNESDSISSQRFIIEDYVGKQSDIELVATFTDDGFTGTNFDRPGVKKLLQAVEDGKINCVIVKDLSRFGRNYIDSGYYLERYFPFHDIRFIAVNDGYDSLKSSSNDEFMMPLKNVINAHYSKDISKKVKSAFKAKQTQGEFIGAFACYGYQKNPADRHRLIIDEDAAQVVRRIFQLYNSGVGKNTIAKILNDEHIPCPSEYKKLKGLNYRNSRRLNLTSYWTYSTVHRVLQNQMYVGDMVQSKSIRKTVRGKAAKESEENWIIVENTHEPIIEDPVWKVTQELLSRRTRQLDFQSGIGLFAGYIKCGDCGRSFSKIQRKSGIYYVCGTYKRYGKDICSSHEIREDMLERLILDSLNKELEKMDYISVPESTICKQQADKQPYIIRLEKIRLLKKELYEDLKSEILTREEYDSYKEEYLREEALLQGQLKAMDDQNQEDDVRNEWVNNLKKWKKLDKMDRETLACILDSITVYETDTEKTVDIKLKYHL